MKVHIQISFLSNPYSFSIVKILIFTPGWIFLPWQFFLLPHWNISHGRNYDLGTAESDHSADVNTGPGSGGLENTENKDVWVISFVSLQPKQSFTLSKISLSGTHLFSFITWTRNTPPLYICIMLGYPKCFHLLHLIWSTQQSSAQRRQKLLLGKQRPRECKENHPGSSSWDNHLHLPIPSSAQTETVFDCKNYQARKLLLQWCTTTNYYICMMSYRSVTLFGSTCMFS